MIRSCLVSFIVGKKLLLLSSMILATSLHECPVSVYPVKNKTKQETSMAHLLESLEPILHRTKARESKVPKLAA